MDEFFAQNRLSAYIDGELPESEMAEMARAIKENPELRESCEQMRRVVALMREQGPSAAPTGFHAQIMAEVETIPIPRGWLVGLRALFARLPREGLALAAVAATVLVLVWQVPRTNHEPEPGTEAAAPARSDAAPAEAKKARADTGATPPASKTAQLEDRLKALEAPTPELDGLAQAGSQDDLALRSTSRTRETPHTTVGAGKGPRLGSARPSSGPAPDEPYMAAWELAEKEKSRENGVRAEISLANPQEEPSGAAESIASLAPIAYRLYPSSPDALRVIVGLAERLGGRAYGTNGQVFKPYTLTDDRNHARLILRVPPGKLDALEPFLKKIGGVSEVSRPLDEMFSGPTVDVEVEILFRP